MPGLHSDSRSRLCKDSTCCLVLSCLLCQTICATDVSTCKVSTRNMQLANSPAFRFCHSAGIGHMRSLRNFGRLTRRDIQPACCNAWQQACSLATASPARDVPANKYEHPDDIVGAHNAALLAQITPSTMIWILPVRGSSCDCHHRCAELEGGGQALSEAIHYPCLRGTGRRTVGAATAAAARRSVVRGSV